MCIAGVDLVHHLTKVSTQKQGHNENLHTRTHKINRFHLKVHLWQQRCSPLTNSLSIQLHSARWWAHIWKISWFLFMLGEKNILFIIGSWKLHDFTVAEEPIGQKEDPGLQPNVNILLSSAFGWLLLTSSPFWPKRFWHYPHFPRHIFQFWLW